MLDGAKLPVSGEPNLEPGVVGVSINVIVNVIAIVVIVIVIDVIVVILYSDCAGGGAGLAAERRQ